MALMGDWSMIVAAEKTVILGARMGNSSNGFSRHRGSTFVIFSGEMVASPHLDSILQVGLELVPRNYDMDTGSPFRTSDIISMIPVYKVDCHPVLDNYKDFTERNDTQISFGVDEREVSDTSSCEEPLVDFPSTRLHKKEKRSGSKERGGGGELGKMDSEMEIETESTPGSIHGNDNVTSLLELARQLITEGKPSLALQAD